MVSSYRILSPSDVLSAIQVLTTELRVLRLLICHLRILLGLHHALIQDVIVFEPSGGCDNGVNGRTDAVSPNPLANQSFTTHYILSTTEKNIHLHRRMHPTQYEVTRLQYRARCMPSQPHLSNSPSPIASLLQISQDDTQESLLFLGLGLLPEVREA